MDRTEGFGVYLDRTLKKIQSVYLMTFEANAIDLTIEQWVILQRIHVLGKDASQSEVVKINYRNRATTSRVIRGLCNKGLVRKERFSGDKKRFKLVLTHEGNAVIEKANPIIQHLRATAGEGIDASDFETFLEVLNSIWNNYDAYEKQQLGRESISETKSNIE
ncbi:MAG: MarR family winged helix-turn-helix transcriptional regulator [Flavobacteriaceae bacterium]